MANYRPEHRSGVALLVCHSRFPTPTHGAATHRMAAENDSFDGNLVRSLLYYNNKELFSNYLVNMHPSCVPALLSAIDHHVELDELAGAGARTLISIILDIVDVDINSISRILEMGNKLIEEEEERNALKLAVLQLKKSRIKPSPFRKLASQQSGVSGVVEQKAAVVAQWLTVLEWRDFSSVKPYEIVAHTSSSYHSTGLGRMADRFNAISQFFVEEILLTDDVRKAAMVVEWLISLAHSLIHLNNFQSAAQILSALGDVSVSRLRSVFKQVSTSSRKQLEEYSALLSVQNNYKNYRERAKKTLKDGKPTIPYIAVLLRDVTFTKDGNPDMLTDKDGSRYNLEKINLLGKASMAIRSYQAHPYHLAACETALHFFDNLTASPSSSDLLYERSLVVEPLSGNPLSSSATPPLKQKQKRGAVPLGSMSAINRRSFDALNATRMVNSEPLVDEATFFKPTKRTYSRSEQDLFQLDNSETSASPTQNSSLSNSNRKLLQVFSADLPEEFLLDENAVAQQASDAAPDGSSLRKGKSKSSRDKGSRREKKDKKKRGKLEKTV